MEVFLLYASNCRKSLIIINIKKMKKIACNIVTYNRKALLKRCLDAVSEQTFKPKVVYIMDNASTDGTIDAVKEWGYYNCAINGIHFKYILNEKNEGSSGGQYLGMKTAFEDDNYDGIWVMDDDGIPDKECLAILQEYLPERDYISPFVLSLENPNLSFGLAHVSYDSRLAKYSNGLMEGNAAPFNGILYSKKLIKTIGFPKREMFIWGDETNYHARAIKAGMPPVTVLKAIHYHPSNRQVIFNYKGRSFVDIDADWKLYCCLRNQWYNSLRYGEAFVIKRYISVPLNYLRYIVAYNKVKSRNIFNLATDALYCAIVGDFSRLNKYM